MSSLVYCSLNEQKLSTRACNVLGISIIIRV